MKYYISLPVFKSTKRLFRKWGERSLECIALWGGYKISEGNCVITTCYVPEQIRSPTMCKVKEGAMEKLLDVLYSTGQVLIAQLHTHPPGMTCLTKIDEEGLAIHYEGFIYIIVPAYGLTDWRLSDCSIYEYKNGSLSPLSQESIRSRFLLLASEVRLRI